MANVNDANGIARKLENEKERVKAADIEGTDRDAIFAYTRHRKTHGTDSGSYADNTQMNDLRTLRLSATRADTPLLDMGIDDLNRFLEALKDKHGMTTGIKNYKAILRPFYGWLDAHDSYGGYGWFKTMTTSLVDFEFKDPSDRRFPTEGEIDGMIAEAEADGNTRDVAMLEYFRESAVRVTLGAQLTLGDIDLSANPVTFTPNENGEAQKGVEVKPYKLYNGVSALRVWITRYHPENRRDGERRDDAPLWCQTHKYHEYTDKHGNLIKKGYDMDNPQDSAISPNAILSRIKKYAGGSGLDTKAIECKPHAFRHAAIGRWKEAGYSLQQVQRRTAWSDKSAAQMWAAYGSADDSRTDAGIADIEGATDPEAGEADTAPEPVETFDCPRCPDYKDIDGDYCPSCGGAVSDKAIQADMEKDDTLTKLEKLAEALDVDIDDL